MLRGVLLRSRMLPVYETAGTGKNRGNQQNGMTMELNTIYNENCMETVKRMPDGFLNTVITSPPYFGLRDYGSEDQFGLEETPEQFVDNLVKLFREIRRALRDDGNVWLNLGDSYAGGAGRWGGTEPENMTGFQSANKGSLGQGKPKKWQHSTIKPKDLIGIPWRVAFALQADGWYLRQDIIWHKPNPMPESVTDRCTKAHEYIFLLSKSAKYWYDADAIKEESRGGSKFNGSPIYAAGDRNDAGRNSKEIIESRNKRSVWTVTTKPFKGAHFATFPEDLIKPCVLAGCPENGIVYDPFGGAGTTALVSHKAGRNWILSELNPEYVGIAKKRLKPYVTQHSLF